MGEVEQNIYLRSVCVCVCVCVRVCVLPREAEEDVNDDGSQLYTLFPVLPQYSGKSTKSCLCTQRHTPLP